MQRSTLGLVAMVIACITWGLSSIYYAQLKHVPALEVLSWRTVSSFGVLAVVLALQGRLSEVPAIFARPRVLGRIALASLLIAVNWFGFIYSVQTGHAMQASLGYYIFPLVAVLLGWILFGERLHWAQWLAVGLAGLAVLILSLGLGVAPWMSLLLAGTFGVYGVLKKGLPVGPVLSVLIEVLLLLPLALWWAFAHGQGLNWDGRTIVLLLMAGPLTGLPLILFGFATRAARLSTVGLVQYLNPTLQFLVATFIFAEPFTPWHLGAFALIWGALALYSVVALRQDRISHSSIARS